MSENRTDNNEQQPLKKDFDYDGSSTRNKPLHGGYSNNFGSDKRYNQNSSFSNYDRRHLGNDRFGRDNFGSSRGRDNVNYDFSNPRQNNDYGRNNRDFRRTGRDSYNNSSSRFGDFDNFTRDPVRVPVTPISQPKTTDTRSYLQSVDNSRIKKNSWQEISKQLNDDNDSDNDDNTQTTKTDSEKLVTQTSESSLIAESQDGTERTTQINNYNTVNSSSSSKLNDLDNDDDALSNRQSDNNQPLESSLLSKDNSSNPTIKTKKRIAFEDLHSGQGIEKGSPPLSIGIKDLVPQRNSFIDDTRNDTNFRNLDSTWNRSSSTIRGYSTDFNASDYSRSLSYSSNVVPIQERRGTSTNERGLDALLEHVNSHSSGYTRDSSRPSFNRYNSSRHNDNNLGNFAKLENCDLELGNHPIVDISLVEQETKKEAVRQRELRQQELEAQRAQAHELEVKKKLEDDSAEKHRQLMKKIFSGKLCNGTNDDFIKLFDGSKNAMESQNIDSYVNIFNSLYSHDSCPIETTLPISAVFTVIYKLIVDLYNQKPESVDSGIVFYQETIRPRIKQFAPTALKLLEFIEQKFKYSDLFNFIKMQELVRVGYSCGIRRIENESLMKLTIDDFINYSVITSNDVDSWVAKREDKGENRYAVLAILQESKIKTQVQSDDDSKGESEDDDTDAW